MSLARKFILILFFFSASAHAISTDKIREDKGDIKSEIKSYIKHHLKDAHSFYLTSFTNDETGKKTYIEIPLPVILYDNGLKFFTSSEFKHGKEVVVSNETYYRMNYDNNKIYKTNKEGTFNFSESGKILNEKPLDFSITKNIATIILVSILMFFLFTSLAKSYKSNNGISKGIGRFFEPIIIYIRDDIARPNIGEKHYKRYMSFLLTVFFFIWFVNLFGLTPFGSNVTNSIAVTASLATLTYVITTFTANKNYWGHIFWMPGVPMPMKIILAPIELLGTIIKPFSLMIRLYANMTAGHVVLMSILGLIFIFQNWLGGSLSFGLAFALALLELLVCALQAYIFTMLSALYFGAAVEEHHHEEH